MQGQRTAWRGLSATLASARALRVRWSLAECRTHRQSCQQYRRGGHRRDCNSAAGAAGAAGGAGAGADPADPAGAAGAAVANLRRHLERRASSAERVVGGRPFLTLLHAEQRGRHWLVAGAAAVVGWNSASAARRRPLAPIPLPSLQPAAADVCGVDSLCVSDVESLSLHLRCGRCWRCFGAEV